jgi:hypothetical protein
MNQMALLVIRLSDECNYSTYRSEYRVTLRKKLAVSTIAASVALTAFAGIPLSSKGLAEKLGVSGVAYAATDSSADFLTEARALYKALDTDGVANVNKFRAEIVTAIQADSSILEYVIGKLPSDKQDEFEDLVTDLMSIPVDANLESVLAQKRVQYADFLKSLVPAGGTLTVDDVAAVVLALESKVISLDISSITESLKNSLITAAKEAVALNANVKAFVTHYEINTADFVPVYEKLQASEHVHIGTALQAGLSLKAAYNKVHSSGSGNGGGGGGGGSIPPVTPVEVPKEAADLVAKLDGLKESIANATGEEKAKLIEAAVKEAQVLVDKLAKLEVTVPIVNGKATVNLDENKTLSAIAGLVAIANGLKVATGGTELPTIKITIDLGAVAQGGIVIDLSTAIIEQAVKANLEAVILKVSDLIVELPIGGTFSSAINFTIDKTDASKEVTGALKAASKQYDFNLSIGGVATTKFSQPIKISIPLGDTAGLDTELLSVAKIVNGKLEFQGGRVENGHIVEPRDTFSSYVVVENKVSFNDTTKVQSWAGRSIEVVAAKGAIVGKSDGVFAPQDKVTRAEFAKMLIRALDLENGSATESFDDVKAGDWHAPYVAAAVQLKIINGRSASKFVPNATITRAEMATMIARALKVSQGAADVADVNAALKGFADASKISATLKDGVAFAATHEIVIGNEGKFLPNNNATRAEAAVIIYRAIKFEK